MDALVNLLVSLRLPLAAAVALSTLLRSGRPMALSELSEATGYAKGHLSSVLRLLEEKSLVERVRLSGRRLLFRARVDGVKALIRDHLRELRSYLRGAIDELSDDSLSRVIHNLETELHALITKLDEV